MQTIEFQKQYLGQKEIKGTESNPFILKIIKLFFPKHDDDSTIAWCAIWAAYVLYKTGKLTWKDVFVTHRTRLASSRYLASLFHESINPKVGDLVLLSRGDDPSKGHIAFLNAPLDLHENFIELFGGNQRDRIGVDNFLKVRIVNILDVDLKK